MAIKSRKAVDPAAIEAFGDAADAPAEPSKAQAAAESDSGGGAPAASRREPTRSTATRRPPIAAATPAKPVRSSANEAWPEDLAKTLTLRYPDPTIPQLLAELAVFDDRSQHNTAIRALRRGLDELKRDAGLG